MVLFVGMGSDNGKKLITYMREFLNLKKKI